MLLPVLGMPQSSAAACFGDCDGDGQVLVSELVTLVDISLGNKPPAVCGSVGGARGGAGGLCIDDLVRAVGNGIEGCPLPELLASHPASQSSDVPPSAWLLLEFAQPPDARSLRRFSLVCDDVGQPVTVSVLPEGDSLGQSTGTGASVVVNPAATLPPSVQCTLSWKNDQIDFTTAPRGDPAFALYDRTDARQTVPFPDDYWLVSEEATVTGVRLDFSVPPGPADLQLIFGSLVEEANQLDGFSQIAPIVVELTDAPDPTTLPRTAAESLDPLATVVLFDLSADSTSGERVPFLLTVRGDTTPNGMTSHTLILFPSIPLPPGHRLGLVVTRRALIDPSRPLDPSDFFAAALGSPVVDEPAAVTRVRTLASEVLEAAGRAMPPILPDDVALALRISVRSIDDLPLDLAAIKVRVVAAAPPQFTITSVEPDADEDVAAIVTGTWQAPDWRDGLYLNRDDAGAPVPSEVRDVPFTLALPAAALAGPVPITMYQHGNPGSSEREVPNQARRYLGAAGFAVIGFTDILNREVSAGMDDEGEAIAAQAVAVVANLLQHKKVPDYWVETHAEQLAFLRMLEGLGDLDVLPIGAPDGMPDLDPTLPLTYVGVSEGGNHAQAFLAYAPEIRAAAALVGGERLAEVLIHQQAALFVDQLGAAFRSLTPADIWVAVSLFQNIFDSQDPHNQSQFIYRNPVEVAGTTRKASILLIEGIDDTRVPNNATDSFAWSMGPIPHLEPVQRPVPFLTPLVGPVRGNIDPDTTAAFFQYVPVGVEGIEPTPGCTVLSPGSAREGHFCAQSAAESQYQRVVFFQSAVAGEVPVIVDPLAP